MRRDEGGDFACDAGGNHLDLLMCQRIEQDVQLEPFGGGDFGIEDERGARGKGEHEGAYSHRREDPGGRSHVVERAEEMLSFQVYAHLLSGLADRRGGEVGVRRLAAPAGKRHVSGPWVAFAVGTTDEEERVGIRYQYHRHSRPAEARLIHLDGGRRGEAAGELFSRDRQLIR